MIVVYTPTVGDGCRRMDLVYPKPTGLWISYNYKGRVREIVDQWPQDEIRVVSHLTLLVCVCVCVCDISLSDSFFNVALTDCRD